MTLLTTDYNTKTQHLCNVAFINVISKVVQSKVKHCKELRIVIVSWAALTAFPFLGNLRIGPIS
jgi:hypothetical protein